MLQPIANAALPEAGIAALVANVATAGAVSSAPFADLLQLIAQGLVAAPKGDAKSLLFELAKPTQDPEGSPRDPMAMLAGSFLPMAMPVGDAPLATQADSAETVDDGMAPPAAMLGKKLPVATADLAVQGRPIAVSDDGAPLPRMSLPTEEAPIEPLTAKSTVVSEAIVAPKANPAPGIDTRTETAPMGNQEALFRGGLREVEATQTSARVAAPMNAPFASQAWRNELGDRLVWMVGQRSQSAELILNPPALGSIEVRLNLNLAGNEAGAQFFSNNANVREALESAFPRLREMLAGAGINLGQASVSQESFQRDQSGHLADNSGTAAPDGLPGAFAGERVIRVAARSAGLVDLYI